jgi:hypothetical protein
MEAAVRALALLVAFAACGGTVDPPRDAAADVADELELDGGDAAADVCFPAQQVCNDN